MIRAKEAREIATKKNEILAKVAIEEVVPKIDEIIRKNADIGNTQAIWFADADYSKYIYNIRDFIMTYGYKVVIDFDDERGHYLNIYW